MNRSTSTYCQIYANTTYNGVISCLTFTGKERDEETGYGYFGARYYDSEALTGWLSVDPMADKYPSMSPYAYCAWNPVKLVDPDGRDTINIKYNARDKKWVIDKPILAKGNNVFIIDTLNKTLWKSMLIYGIA